MMNPPNLRYKDRVSDSIGRDDSDTIRHELEAHFIPDNNEPLHSDLYEQIDQLEAIDVDELVKLLADGSQETITKPVSLTDFFEGLAQLATVGVVEVTDIVEAIHREVILRPLGRFNENHLNKWQRGITGRIYGTIRHVMLMVGNNLASVLRVYKNIIMQKTSQPLPESLKKLVNVLNGVMGDHLVNSQNPLAIPMVLYDKDGNPQCEVLSEHEKLPAREKLSGRVVILCHGLCMSHLSWQSQEGNGLGSAISLSQPDTTVLYLDYNTGRRISRSGRKFCRILQDLVDDNPNISQLDLIGHSMGGLVSRSALFYGEQDHLDWVKRVGNLITLGSPHHGAVLERIGNYVQEIIAKLPFAGSLAKLGDMRSAGIIDLRHGSIRDVDWKSLEGRSVLPQDFRHPTGLPSGIKTYFVASALVETHYDSKMTDLLGDGLVSVASALGEDDTEHALFVPDGHKAVFYGVSHMNLINSRRVREQVVAWLLDNGQRDYTGEDRIYSYPRSWDVAV
ncbi:GPI inositol-deacylase [Psychrobacter fozii]|uniref:GPI inositol-deacylase n=1 Tax=Psychrobacter fozii TaxID=198480 RepID=UPI001D104C01|nr:GPI inositol-deacylase [Psychrobacter fozii]